MARPISKNIPISSHIRMMMDNAGVDIEDIAEVTGKSIPVLRNKLSHGTFSIEELLAIVEITGGVMTVKQSGGYEYTFLPTDLCSEETYQRIMKCKERIESRRMQKLEKAFEESRPEDIEKTYSRWLKKRKKEDSAD